LFENLEIQNSLLLAALEFKVERLIFLGSSCIYPKFAQQPIHESALHAGALEETNRPYAIAKMAGLEGCWAINRQYGTSFLSVMPTNLFGPDDNYHPTQSHVIPGLIRRIHEAKVQNLSQVTVWGSGTPLREFLFSDDLAKAINHLLELESSAFDRLCCKDSNSGPGPTLNVGTGEEISIADLARVVARVVGYSGNLLFDADKPDGTPRKVLNSEEIQNLGWKPAVNLESGLEICYSDFLENHA
jgi:GDP-L-fucose synthase